MLAAVLVLRLQAELDAATASESTTVFISGRNESSLSRHERRVQNNLKRLCREPSAVPVPSGPLRRAFQKLVVPAPGAPDSGC